MSKFILETTNFIQIHGKESRFLDFTLLSFEKYLGLLTLSPTPFEKLASAICTKFPCKLALGFYLGNALNFKRNLAHN